MIIVLGLWYALTAGVIFLRLRWAIICYLLLASVDFSGGRGSVALYNVVKGAFLPLFLLYRTRHLGGHRQKLLPPVAWVFLVAYVGIATLWSVFPLSSVKLVIQMMCSLAIAMVFIRATKSGELAPRDAVPAAIGTLLLGVLRGLVFPQWGDDPARFTGFLAAQGYAAYLAALYCVVLTGRGINLYVRIAVCGALAVAVYENGSRTWLFGVVLATMITLIVSRVRLGVKVLAIVSSVALLLIMLAGADRMMQFLGSRGNRIVASVVAFYTGEDNPEAVGTFNFRREINDAAIANLKHSTPAQLIFGRGTCSGALVTGHLFQAYKEFADPNRMFHDEWLRVIYEWGFIGEIFWLMFVGSLIHYAITGWKLDRNGDARALLVYMPSFFVALADENILAGAGVATSVGFLLTIALATIPYREAERKLARLRLKAVLLLRRRIRQRAALAGTAG